MKPTQLPLSGFLLCVLSFSGTLAVAENALTVGRATAKNGDVGEVPLKLSGNKDVQGFVMVFEWDSSKAKGVDVIPNDGAGKPLAGADLVQTRVEDGFIILAVVLDIDGQDGEKIPKGNDIQVGTAMIRCLGPAQGTEEVALKLVDNKYARVDGGPLLSNIISSEGLSIGKGEGLAMKNGTLVCEGEEGPPTGGLAFASGGALGDDGNPKDLSGPRDSTVKVNFYYRSPDSGSGNKNKIQGLSMAVQYSCDLSALEDTIDLDALDDAGAEFVHFEIDNLPVRLDKDGCEFTLGVLVDAKSPFDGHTLPTATSFKRLFTIDFLIEDDADCGKCYWVKFMDGLNGNGKVTVDNRVSINFLTQKPELRNSKICVKGDSTNKSFIRGDCNFSSAGGKAVDISDAAAEVGYILLSGDAKFDAPCDDACDANDDGRLDAADVVYLLNYLFVPKSPKIPAPGVTTAGKDPTDDKLGCKGGKSVDGNDCD